MPKSRQITRENRKREEQIDRQNKYGINDPTPYKAVRRIMQAERKEKITCQSNTGALNPVVVPTL